MLWLFVNTDNTLGAARTLCVAQVGRWKSRAEVTSDSTLKAIRPVWTTSDSKPLEPSRLAADAKTDWWRKPRL
jgi:hypothetical protein